MKRKIYLFFVVCASTFTNVTNADIGFRNWDDPDAIPWAEGKHRIPEFPKEENLIEFFVQATATSKYFIDLTSISIGETDGVVRYSMVIKTAGGARNVTYEGIHCKESSYKIYATGRSNDKWSVNPQPEWKVLKSSSLNIHQDILSRYYFCPHNIPIYTVDEGQNALKRGGHPNVTSLWD